MSYNQENIRNFCIIAHIDHGKSTLADRILELTSTVAKRDMEDQLLDNMDIERERGITIKARAVRLNYKAKDGKDYVFNLIDTPGHVDFNYEVSRSLVACEGAILIVDASQGIEAQTLANTYLAIENDLEVMPVVNKIDLPSADPDRVCNEVENIIGIPAMDAPRISAKMGTNIEEVLERVVTDIPCPKGDNDKPLKALICDCFYDSYKGVIIYVRVLDGEVKIGQKIKLMATGAEFTVVETGYMGATDHVNAGVLHSGEVGYITASIKYIGDTKVGDTVTDAENPCDEALPGYREVNPMVFSGIYPADGARYGDLRDALDKLQLNDASLHLSLKLRLRWDLVSVAVSLGCSIWKLFRNVLSESSILTLSQLLRRLFSRLTLPTAKRFILTTRQTILILRLSLLRKNLWLRLLSFRQAISWATLWNFVRADAVFSRI